MTQGSSQFISAILLAAGTGERMGGIKQLLKLGQRRMVEASLHNLAASRVGEVIVVLGFAAEQIIPFIERKNAVKVVINPRFGEGMSTSIHHGLRTMDPRTTGVLIALADQPFIPPQVIDELIERFVTGGKGIVLPIYQGQRGHPVILDRERYERELFGLHGDVGGRQVVHKHPDDVLEVAVSSWGVVVDIDEPEYYQKIRF